MGVTTVFLLMTAIKLRIHAIRAANFFHMTSIEVEVVPLVLDAYIVHLAACTKEQ